MPIAPTDVLVKYSASGAASGNSATGSVASSLGKYISTTEIPDATMDNFFPDMTAAENAALNVDYCCIFVHNNHATDTLLTARVWMVADFAGGATMAIAVDPTGVTALGSATAQAVTIATKNNAPAGVGPFTEPLSAAAALPIGDIGPGHCAAVWIRRTATNSGPVNLDSFTIRIDGDTIE